MVCDNCGTCESCGTDADESSSTYHPHKHLEHGFKKFWRPMAAYIYLAICIFDFMGAPLWIEHANQTINVAAFEEIRKFDNKEVQIKAIEHIELGNRSWTPLTLQGGGLFHLAFGAILGISAFARGREKVAAINGR